jgi:hypothetical protein
MVSLMIDLAMFFLVLFVLLPGMMIFAMLMRDIISHNHNRKHAGWHKEALGKSTR